MLKNKLRICINGLFALLVLLVTSCYQSSDTGGTPTFVPIQDLAPNLVDRSWLTGKPCNTACWYGLKPGKSSLEDAISIISSLSFINPDSIKTQEVNLTKEISVRTVQFECKSPRGQSCGHMNFSENILSDLFLKPNYQVTFEQAVEKLGQPDGFYYSHLGSESTKCAMMLLWTVRQLALEYTDDQYSSGDGLCDRIRKANWKAPGGLFVQTVTYMLPARIEQIKSNDTYITWNGFDK